MNGLKVRDSKIEGKGLFADKEFNEGDVIGIAHINDVATSMIGRFHNHSDNPNAHSISIGNKRYLAALRPLMKGEEITVDYRRQPELEQPEEFKKGGLVKMPKPSKKGLASKKYTKSVLGTNRLFTKNPLYEKPKSKKNRVYDPNAKYYQDGGFVQLDRAPGNKFKKDTGGRWVYESGAPVTDTMILQELNYGKGKPIGSPVVQSAPKYEAKVPMSNAERKQKISDLKKSPQISDQQEADRLFEVQREQDIYYPDVSDQLMRPPKNMDDLKGTEWIVNSSLGFPMDKARLAADAAAGLNNDPVDNFRHPSAGRYTAEAIADYTGNIPYISPALGFIGSNLSGIGHEVSTLISGRDERDWPTKLKEAGEDIYNNYVGSKVGASDMTPEEKTNYLLYLSYNNLLPDGIEGGKNRKGQTNNMYFKKGPNDPGKYKSSYQEGGEPGKIRFVPGTYDPTEMAGYMSEQPEVTVSKEGAPWVKYMREYEEKNPMDQFITDKKKAYLKKSGLNRAAGNNMDRIPDRVIQNFIDEYNYKKNSYVTKKYGKEAGFNPSRRGEWVDEINPTFKERFVADSKYGSKLQPNTWDRALAGLATLASPWSPDLQAELNAGTPGLTRKESREIKDLNLAGVPLGGLEVFAPSTIVGQNIANKLKNVGLSSGSDYKELPGLLSGEYMSNVDEGDATGLDPIGVLSTIYSGAQLPMMIGKGASLAAKGIKQAPEFIDNALATGINKVNTQLEKNAGRFYKPKAITNLPVEASPERLRFLQDIEDVKNATAFDNPIEDQMTKLRKLYERTTLPDDVFEEASGYSKADIFNTAKPEAVDDARSFQRVAGDLDIDNQLPPPPQEIFTPELNIDIPPRRSMSTSDRVIELMNQSTPPDNSAGYHRIDLTQDPDFFTDYEVIEPATDGSYYQTFPEDFREMVDQNRNPLLRFTDAAKAKALRLEDAILDSNTVEQSKKLPGAFKKMFTEPTAKYPDEYALTTLYANRFKSPRQMHEDLVTKMNTAVNNAKVGDIITGSTNTSYNSYIPQMGYIFKNAGKQGLSEPVFLGYEPMNASGFLSKTLAGDVNQNDILAHLNKKINQLQKRVGKNMRFGDHPIYMDEYNNIMLPQYGLKKLKTSKIDMSKKLKYGGEVGKLKKFTN